MSKRTAIAMAGLVGLLQMKIFHYAEIHWADALGANASLCTLLFVAVCAVLAVVRRFNEPVCETVCGTFGWAVSMATGDATAVLLASSYVGSTLQGVAHELTGEKPTLGGYLETVSGAEQNQVADEVGHTTFFPALLLQACCQSAAGEGKR